MKGKEIIEFEASNSQKLVIGVIIVITCLTLGIATTGAVGLAEGIYGAIIGAAIGSGLAKAFGFDILDSTIVGSCVGILCGIVYAKYKSSEDDDDTLNEGESRNSDYSKVVGCVAETLLNNGTNIIKCTGGTMESCIELAGGFKPLYDCTHIG